MYIHIHIYIHTHPPVIKHGSSKSTRDIDDCPSYKPWKSRRDFPVTVFLSGEPFWLPEIWSKHGQTLPKK